MHYTVRVTGDSTESIVLHGLRSLGAFARDLSFFVISVYRGYYLRELRKISLTSRSIYTISHEDGEKNA